MYRFTIRDVLWLTVVVALAVGWWTEHLARVEAAQGATSLADFSLNGPACGLAASGLQALQQKYGAEKFERIPLIEP